MKRSSKLFVVAFAAVIAGSAAKAQSSEPKGGTVDLELCDFRVPSVVSHANATFSMIFAFQVGEHGLPTNISTIEGHFLDERVFIECLKKWRIGAPFEEKVLVEFDWVHSKGWTRLSVTGASVGVSMKIAPGACVASGSLTNGNVAR